MILALETSTKNCSVALINGAELMVLKEAHSDQYIHSEKLHLFIEAVLEQASCKPGDLEAIAVGAGPGSYTGLRIGVTSAKALAYSLEIPLISARGPELLVAEAIRQFELPEQAILHPMIDARRMEVYTADYSREGMAAHEIEARIINEDSYDQPGEHFFFGDGAAKFKTVLKREQHHFLDLELPSAAHFRHLLNAKIENKDFEDVAYFEPFYLKEFQAIKPKSVF